MTHEFFVDTVTKLSESNWVASTYNQSEIPTKKEVINQILMDVFSKYHISVEWAQDSNTLLDAWVSTIPRFPRSITLDKLTINHARDIAITLSLSQYANLLTIANVQFNLPEFSTQIWDFNSDFSSWDKNLIEDLTTKLEANGFNIVDRDWLLEPYTYSEPYYQGKTLMDRLFGYT